jgi:hypothetical protein
MAAMWRLASSLLFVSSLLSLPLATAAVNERLALPSRNIIDLEISSNGNLYLLCAGFPHMVILHPDSSVTELDLNQVSVPGGMCLVDQWGFFVSDALSGRILRFGSSGELLAEFDSPGRPGDVVLAGLELWYYSRDEGTVRSAGSSEVVIFTVPSPGEGSLSYSESTFLFSGSEGTWLFGTGEKPVRISSGTSAAITRRSVLILDEAEGLLTVLNGDTLASFEQGSFNRISCSPNGGTVVLWSRNGSTALVIR